MFTAFRDKIQTCERFKGTLICYDTGTVCKFSGKSPLSSYKTALKSKNDTVQELCESRGGRPGLSVLTSLLVSVDVKIY